MADEAHFLRARRCALVTLRHVQTLEARWRRGVADGTEVASPFKGMGDAGHALRSHLVMEIARLIGSIGVTFRQTRQGILGLGVTLAARFFALSGVGYKGRLYRLLMTGQAHGCRASLMAVRQRYQSPFLKGMANGAGFFALLGVGDHYRLGWGLLMAGQTLFGGTTPVAIWQLNQGILLEGVAVGTWLMTGDSVRYQLRFGRRFLVAGQAHLGVAPLVASGEWC